MLNRFYLKYGKRLFDILASVLGLILLSPVFAAAAVIIKAGDGGPVFYRQNRVGRSFKSFSLLKFRTMIDGADRDGPSITVAGDRRITKLGRFLRRTKLDELPQLLNVLFGQMSLVGPRPEVPRYVDLFRKDYELILSVKPGITDFATIEFRDEETVLKKYSDPEEGYVKAVLPRKINLYKKYLSERGLWTDIQLIILTLFKIVYVSPRGHHSKQ